MIAILLIFPLGNAAAETPIRIAALGDSLIQGYGLPAEDGYVPQLNRWLSDQGASIEVLNAGVSGDTTAGGLARVDWTLTPEVKALIVALGGNDLLRGIDPAVVRANLDGILAIAKARGLPVLLIPQVAPENYGPDYKADFDAIYGDLAVEYDAAIGPSFLSVLLTTGGDLSGIADLMQGDNIHPNAKGVGLIVEATGPFVVALSDRVSP